MLGFYTLSYNVHLATVILKPKYTILKDYFFLKKTVEEIAEYTARNVETTPALFRSNTHPKRFTHGCTRKFTIYSNTRLTNQTNTS